MGIKQEQIGKHEMTVVQFGTGDIGMVEIEEQNTESKAIFFWQDEPKPVEDWDVAPGSLTSDVKHTDDMEFKEKPVIFRFTKSRSVSQVIQQLQELYDKMNLEETKALYEANKFRLKA